MSICFDGLQAGQIRQEVLSKQLVSIVYYRVKDSNILHSDTIFEAYAPLFLIFYINISLLLTNSFCISI